MQQFSFDWLFRKVACTIDEIKEALNVQIPEVPGMCTGIFLVEVIKRIAFQRAEEIACFVSRLQQKVGGADGVINARDGFALGQDLLCMEEAVVW